ncbi:MAG TPA: FAD-dependent oxidoreductase [Gammaproteobacteria bacterium]|nr:FAD-dependent oxidoreductase [Gammaproteobacteria bacterium]HEV2613581.1 FAD-dependent oxidoreductase [Gammaproteobacteria bacterium]
MKNIDWAVVGAGPAGIAAIGKLLDAGVEPHRIAWIDPAFAVGDFGTKWLNVPSNTKVGLFLKYLEACQAFEYATCKENFALNRADPDQTCFLNIMAEPLRWVTQRLMKKVSIFKNSVEALSMQNNHWHIQLSDSALIAKNVVLAVGSEPKAFSHSGITTIPLEIAMDSGRLAEHCNGEDNIAVFGSSHSAILIIRSLLEVSSVKKVINFYRAPLRYAVYLDESEILFDDTGLKGTTAEWARKNLHGALPPKLEQIYSSDENVEHYLPLCNKAIYAIGFERRSIPITGIGKLEYNPHNGIIAPGLFGLGIAFPQAKTDRFGNLEYRVGLWKFMDYLSSILPIWMRYSL